MSRKLFISLVILGVSFLLLTSMLIALKPCSCWHTHPDSVGFIKCGLKVGHWIHVDTARNLIYGGRCQTYYNVGYCRSVYWTQCYNVVTDEDDYIGWSHDQICTVCRPPI